MSTRQISLKDFAAHCMEEIRAARNDGSVLELLSAGRVVAVVSPAPVEEKETLPPEDDWMGRGAGLMSYGPNYDPAAPAFAPEDWEAFQEHNR